MFAVSMDTAIELYADIVAAALPIAIAFGIGNIIIDTFLTAAFGGGLRFGGRK